MLHEITKTNNFRFQYNKLPLRMKRFVDEAIEILKESPKDFQGRITAISRRKEGHLYRIRVPGAHILYILTDVEGDDQIPVVIMNNIKLMY